MAQLVDLVIDRRVLLDVAVSAGNIGLRLVIVVVGNEVFHGVLREEFLEFRAELGGEYFVVSKYKSWLVDLSDDIGHGEGLS